ncbi:MAG TPA: LPS export ABC transporter permease LptF [Steroidobacteraceae bacterium]|nr:LPS export ABC transporter permease LptF [Steroidobacteraceae bacterium]
MKILDRYILREVTLTWVAVTGVLLIILVTNQMARVLQRAAESHFPREVVLALIGFSSLENLTVLVPVGLLLAIVLTFGRLYHESEMAAVHACGVGVARLSMPLLALTAVLAGLLGWLSLDLAPRAAGHVQDLRSTATRDAEFGSLEPGRFHTFGGSDGVFYAGGAEPDGTLRDVFVKLNRNDTVEIAVAARARHVVSEGGQLHTLILLNGKRYEGVPGSAQFRMTTFEEHGIPVRLPEPQLTSTRLELKPTAELLASDSLEDQAELQWRLSMPIMAFVLTLLAVPLSRLRPRQGRYARIGLAILLYFIYTNLLSAAKIWLARGIVPPVLGLWWVHVALVALALLAILNRAIWLRLRPRRAAPA